MKHNTTVNIIEQLKDYQYLYETHLHTCQGSACARDTGPDMVKAAMNYGYSGIIVTEHNWGGNTCINRKLPWEEWVQKFALGYIDAKMYGDAHDFDVFFGYEAGYYGTEFLIYGVDVEWMLSHPELRHAGMEEHFRLVHEAGGMVIHAHPYREEWYIPEIRLYPDLVDGVEGINATHSNSRSQNHNKPEFDSRAIEYARKNNLPMTAGSDIHTTDMFGGGVAFKHKLTSIQDYCNAIRENQDYILTNGEKIWDSKGKII